MRHFFVSSLVLLSLLSGTSYADSSEPASVVKAFHDALIRAMKTESFEDRLGIARPAVRKHFHVQTIARISLGRNWRSLDAAAQADYQGLMETLITTTYASRFKQFNDQRFSIVKTEPITDNRVRVRSVLASAKETVNLDYQLQQREDKWLIYDIVANGVSDLSMKRSNYAALFTESGLAGVKAEIERTIRRNREEQTD